RESQTGYERLGEIWETQQAEHPEDWLLSMEIFEILDMTDQQPELKTRIEKFLNEKKTKTKDLATLIGWGFRLVEYHKQPEYQATRPPSLKQSPRPSPHSSPWPGRGGREAPVRVERFPVCHVERSRDISRIRL